MFRLHGPDSAVQGLRQKLPHASKWHVAECLVGRAGHVSVDPHNQREPPASVMPTKLNTYLGIPYSRPECITSPQISLQPWRPKRCDLRAGPVSVVMRLPQLSGTGNGAALKLPDHIAATLFPAVAFTGQAQRLPVSVSCQAGAGPGLAGRPCIRLPICW